MMPQSPVPEPAIAGEIVGESPLRIWSLTPQERLRRQLHRAHATADVASARLVVVVRADWVYDQPLVQGLASQQNPCGMWLDGQCVALVVPPAGLAAASELLVAGQAPAELPRMAPEEIAGSYNMRLRKREPPFLMPLTAERLDAIHARVFAGSYKGVTDFVTLHLWPRPARAFTMVCANLGISPNMVTSASLVLVLVAMWAFWHGHFGWGLVAAWFMTFLDTVDGKLARVTLNSSKFGDVFDHAIDLIHPPFWWWAWVVGLSAVGMGFPDEWIALDVIIIGYIVQRVLEGLFDVAFKLSPHMWQRFDSLFRQVTARRNPNLAILTVATLFGRPDVGMNIVAVWVAICLVVHAVRFLQAAFARRHGPLHSWLR